MNVTVHEVLIQYEDRLRHLQAGIDPVRLRQTLTEMELTLDADAAMCPHCAA
jgi:hypothetical protein